MGSHLLDAIISRELDGSGCRKLLSGDGITSPDLTIKGMLGVFEGFSIDTRLVRKSVPAIGDASSVAKNLDEYQFLLCLLVPTLPDSDPSKLQLQKYRVAIVAAFARLAGILRELKQDDLEPWVTHARLLLEETSDAYVKVRTNASLRVIPHKETFEFFGMPEESIEAALRAFYGQE
ncbi:MAG: hypothetical protein ACREAQ_04240 [Nitrososphaera sp.]